MKPEDAASDFADAIAVRELRSIRDTITAKLREAYLAGYAHAAEQAAGEGIDPDDAAALADALNAFDRETLEALAPNHTDLRDAMREDWIDPDNADAVTDAAATLINEGRAEIYQILNDVDNDRIDGADLADYIGDTSVCRIPDELRDVLSTGFDLHGIDTLAELATELQWQLALPDRSAA